MFVNRGSFTPHNRLKEKERPNFRQRKPDSSSQQTSPRRVDHTLKTATSLDLPPHRETFYTPEPTSERSITLSELGNSSSLFSYDSPASSDFGSAVKPRKSDLPIPFVFSIATEPRRLEGGQNKKMVNERSPAKASLQAAVLNEQGPKEGESSYAPKPKSTVPQFGQPTFPSSPLHRAPVKDSGLFIQPKSRPEHHRDGDKPGMGMMDTQEIMILIIVLQHILMSKLRRTLSERSSTTLSCRELQLNINQS